MSWSASADDVAVTAYEVYRGGALAATVNAPGLSFVDGGRSPSTTYSYTVRARDAHGNTSLDSTPPASATTPAATTTTITLEPVADAYVQDLVTTNNGTSTQLRLDAAPITRAYLKFTLTGLNAAPSKVELRVYANNTTLYAAGFSASAWRTPAGQRPQSRSRTRHPQCRHGGIDGAAARGGRLPHHHRHAPDHRERHLLDRPDDDQLDRTLPRQPPVNKPTTTRHHDLIAPCQALHR